MRPNHLEATMPDISAAALRPDDRDLLRGILRRLAGGTPGYVLMAGLVDHDAFTITELVGTETDSLHRLFVRAGEGVGGGAVARGRPTAVNDYVGAPQISHQHDGAVRREGLRSMVAVPVTVDGATRAVLYAATRDEGSLGDAVATHLLGGARAIGGELHVRDEVDRRLAALRGVDPTVRADDRDARDAVRVAHAELTALAAATTDPTLAARLLAIDAQLVGARQHDAPQLSARESDVLAQVALGCTYAETARRLTLQPDTVKGYMQTIMAKLGAHSRHEAVATARRLGLLP
jgi:LuxR family transcriptional regulator, regulator of acetate metabolism